MAVEIFNVDAGSPAERAGLKKGMLLVAVNGNDINDVLDYGFYSACEEVVLTVNDGGRLLKATIEKDEYEDIGLDFSDFLMDSEHSCDNDCIFCFVDQLPAGLRKSLYFKDDDDRLSYLFGNYLSLTNISDAEIERIIRMRVSPINISVHTTDPKLRCLMLRNERAGEVLSYMKKLAAANIEMNCQIVVCRGINDGDSLRSTLRDLVAMHPAVASVAVVPVGLTKHREGLFPLEAHDAQSAREVLDIVGEFNRECKPKHGVNLVYPADEWFLLAGEDIPEAEYYDDMPQYENGVGMLAKLRDEFVSALRESNGDDRKICTDIACGTAPEEMLNILISVAKVKYPNIECIVHPIKNEFLGESITVSGLVTATDIKKQLTAHDMIGDTLYIPNSMLRSEGDMFLDSVTVEELSHSLGVSVRPVDYDGEALLEIICGKYRREE